MEFYNDEIEQIRHLVKEHALNGNVFIAFCDNGEKVFMDDLAFFQDSWSANEYCYENSTDLDRYAITTTEKIVSQLDKQLEEKQVNNLKSEIMKPENLEFLKEQVKNAGFGEVLNDELTKLLETNKELKATISHTMKLGEGMADAVLNFRYDPAKDMHFFNSYDLKITPEDKRVEGPRQRTFSMAKDNRFTVDEANNLLNHRFVNKDMVSPYGEKCPDSWARLNFRETDSAGNFKLDFYPQNYGFDVKAVVERYPIIKELGNEEDKNALIASLKKGNKAEVTLVRKGKEDEKGFVATNAYLRSLHITDSKGVKVIIPKKDQSQNKEQSENTGVTNDTKENQQNNAGDQAKNDQKNDAKQRKGLHA